MGMSRIDGVAGDGNCGVGGLRRGNRPGWAGLQGREPGHRLCTMADFQKPVVWGAETSRTVALMGCDV